MTAPRPLTLKNVLIAGSARGATLDLHGHVTSSPHVFAGLATWPNGGYVASFSAVLPDELYRNLIPQRHVKKPDAHRSLAFVLHEAMIQTRHQRDGQTVRQLRLEACRARAVGGKDPANVDRQHRQKLTNATALEALRPVKFALTHLPKNRNEAPAAVGVTRDAIVLFEPSRVRILGDVWLCRWGDRRATFGNMDINIESAAAREICSLAT